MGRRSSEMTKKKAKVVEALAELHALLADCQCLDGTPTVIEINIKGAKEESMTVELSDLNETLEIMQMNY